MKEVVRTSFIIERGLVALTLILRGSVQMAKVYNLTLNSIYSSIQGIS